MAYTDKTQIDNYLGTVLPNTLTTQLNTWITSVAQWIENYVGFSFENSTASDRYFDGSGDRELLVDLYYELVSIKTLDTNGDEDLTLDTSDMAQYPLNRTQKDRIRLLTNAGLSKFPNRQYSVKINAKWGWGATVPAEISFCATKLMAKLLEQRLHGGKVASESLGDYSVSYKDIDDTAEALGVKNILDQYRNLSI